ncbi:MAG: K(+)-transporting ATPase subunit C [Chitinophagaceae bacterium]
MKKNLLISLRLTIVLVVLLGLLYPLLIAAVGKLTPGEGNGEKVVADNKVVGYKLIGQSFTGDRYFWGRPSAVNYNAAGSGGSNKGPSNPDYLQQVKDRIDSFLVHNPGVQRSDIPAELVTASGSGLDPDISPAGAFIQVKRVAIARQLSETVIKQLVEKQVRKPLAGLGPEKVNVLQLNIALDQLK